NMGAPLETGKKALLAFLDFCETNKIKPKIRGIGTTGYGEKLFATAFMADYHTVETIAHKEAAVKFCPDVSFVLDLGGQDMKAIFIKNGIITNIILNEACSAGCGSFLETYAKTLGIEASQIASHAFASKSPSILGSRCTVFMNSSVITELRNGKSVDDILAGLCRSIVENIFTKVVRIANFDEMGNKIVVQGGTFKNDAVLRAFENYIGKEVIRPPYCGEMGALGIALLCRKHMLSKKEKSKGAPLLTRENLEKFTYSIKNDSRCGGCANFCSRHIVTFSHRGAFVTGNRCERGLKDIEGSQSKETTLKKGEDLLAERYVLLFRHNSSLTTFDPAKAIGIPRVLEFFDSFPFWNEFFKELGFTVILSDESNYKLFESGLPTVPSDTVCLPAKIVHGHINSLLSKGIKTIFLPVMLKNIKENEKQDDSWFCAVLQGYPEVIRLNGCIPENQGIRFLTPSFKFSDKIVRDRQIIEFIQSNFNVPFLKIVKAIRKADKEVKRFREKLVHKGKKILDELKRENRFGVVIACRPYHNDPFINHSLSKFFTRQGIPVLVNEALPYVDNFDFGFTRIDTINTFHNRMLAAAKFVAEHPNLEMVQIVSFGCGHDAVLTDEIARILKTYGGKELLTLKVDEGENEGPLNIRITSFIETIKTKRERDKQRVKTTKSVLPFEIKFKKEDKQTKTVLIPNLSWSFSVVISRALKNQGYNTQILPVAGKEAIALGKRYVNNDICYPAQINIGEILYYLKNNPDKVAISAAGLAKNCNDCRACHYAALARKALDDAGFERVPITTTSFEDKKDIHPGFKLNRLRFSIDMVRGIALIDALDEMARICRPYEFNKGETDRVHQKWTQYVIEALGKSWKEALNRLDKAVDAFNNIKLNRQIRKPRVGIIGEILVNFHESGNYRIVRYLEEHGMEVVLPNLIEFWRQDVVNYEIAAKNRHVRLPLLTRIWGKIYESVFDTVINDVEKKKRKFFRYKPHPDIKDIASKAAKIMNISFRTGEGWLIPGEIVNWIEEGVESFIIVQPFGCLPNHISGKGIVKTIRNLYPYVKIITLDFDPDTSLANVHNRLQMIIVGSETKKTSEVCASK
ncbi:MAG: acyl-CoA dehydratase activase-related protein, partial [Chitinispirillaceae bacterium]|nr:acyl-CoA dehydratase activase-related protein [Chitinispirillaceae bacterium]